MWKCVSSNHFLLRIAIGLHPCQKEYWTSARCLILTCMAPVPEDSPLLHLAFLQHRAGHGQGCRRTCSTSTGCPSHHGNRTQGGAGLHWQHHLVGQDRIHGGGSKPLPCQLCEVPTSLLLPSHEKGYFRSCVMFVFCMADEWSWSPCLYTSQNLCTPS